MADEPTPQASPKQQAAAEPQTTDPEATPQEIEVAARKEEILEREQETADARGRDARTWEELQDANRRTAAKVESQIHRDTAPFLTHPL